MSRAEEMGELLARWRESGQSLLAFGKQEGVSYAKLLYWKRKVEGEPQTPAKKPELVEVEVVQDVEPNEAQPAKFEVWLSNGVGLDVPAGFDQGELQRLVEVLRAC